MVTFAKYGPNRTISVLRDRTVMNERCTKTLISGDFVPIERALARDIIIMSICLLKKRRLRATVSSLKWSAGHGSNEERSEMLRVGRAGTLKSTRWIRNEFHHRRRGEGHITNKSSIGRRLKVRGAPGRSRVEGEECSTRMPRSYGVDFFCYFAPFIVQMCARVLATPIYLRVLKIRRNGYSNKL